VPAPPGTGLQFEIAGECGGAWYLVREPDSWRLVDRLLGRATSQITIPQEIAWRIFTKGIDRAAAAVQVQVMGDRELGLHVLAMTAIVG
jgi:hypothetical protein